MVDSCQVWTVGWPRERMPCNSNLIATVKLGRPAALVDCCIIELELFYQLIHNGAKGWKIQLKSGLLPRTIGQTIVIAAPVSSFSNVNSLTTCFYDFFLQQSNCSLFWPWLEKEHLVIYILRPASRGVMLMRARALPITNQPTLLS